MGMELTATGGYKGLYLYDGSAVRVTSTDPITTGVRYVVHMTLSAAGVLKFYVNGVQTGNNLTGTFGVLNNTFNVGGTFNNNQDSNSTFWDAKFLINDMTADEVLDDYNKRTYDEINIKKSLLNIPFSSYSDGGITYAHNRGTIATPMTVGDGTTATTFPTAQAGGSYYFDGGDYLQLADNSGLDFPASSPFSVVLAYRSIPDGGSAQYICGKVASGKELVAADATSYGWDITARTDLANDFLYFNLRGDNGTLKSLPTATAFTSLGGDIKFVVCVMNWTNSYIYLNGKLNNSGSVSGASTLANDGKFMIGQSQLNNYGLTGNLYPITIYPIALTPLQIRYMTAQFFRTYHS